MREVPTDTPHCPACDGTRLQALLWVELKSNLVIDGDEFDTDCFCPDCETHVRHCQLQWR